MSSFPACQVCHQKFSLKGPAPFLLPCLHSLCETCVTSADGGVISCSTCQRDVNLTETRLQKDVITEKEILHLTVQQNPELVLCTHEDDGNQAVCWCKECEDFLCEHCQNVHDSFKITKQHTIYDVGDLEVGELKEDRYCRVHSKFIADTWDKDCCMLTCRKCRLGNHSGHKTIDVEEVAQTSRRTVSTFQEEIKYFVDIHEGHSTEATKDLENSVKISSILPEKISHTFNSLKTILDQREVEIRIAHQQLHDDVTRQLQVKKNSSDINHKRCQTISDYISKALKYSSMHDIVELRSVLEEKSKDCRSSTPSVDYKSLSLPAFNTEGMKNIKSSLCEFGVITTDDMVLGNRTEVTEIETQTRGNLKTENEHLQRMLKQSRASEYKLSRENMEFKKSFTYWILNVNKRLAIFLAMIAAAVIITKLGQMVIIQENLTKENIEVEKVSDFDRMMENMLDKSCISHILNRPHVEFSRTRYNADVVHINDEGELINDEGELINTPHPNHPHSDHRLKKYRGTSSTVPLTQSGSPQYWEVKTHVDSFNLFGNSLLLEIGLAREEEQDQHHCIAGQLHSYTFTVSRCPEHSSECTEVWRHGQRLLSLPVTLENTPGTAGTLHYGVVYDSSRRRIAFLDLERGITVGKIDNVDSTVDLWPMFGVYNSFWSTVRMSLVVGHDIDMTEDKKALILESLT